MDAITVIVPLTMQMLLLRCAPSVGPVTMSAIVAYESGGRANAIHDNTTQRSYFPAGRAEAQHLAALLLRAKHNIDVGYAQVNSANFPHFGLSVASAFDPCTNVATGSRILRGAYAATARTYGPGQTALVHALSAYNTGGFSAGIGYAHAVYATAAQLHYERLQPNARRHP